jgi:hypothetical protein
MAARTPAQPASRSANPTDNSVQRTRAWTGLWVVVGGDMAIGVAAILALWKTSGSSTNTSEIAILTSAFTAISTMTTAYFGIKTMSNTAQSFAPAALHTAVAAAKGLAADGDGTGGDGPGDGGSAPGGPPVPADPSNPTAAEIVARMAEPTD